MLKSIATTEEPNKNLFSLVKDNNITVLNVTTLQTVLPNLRRVVDIRMNPLDCGKVPEQHAVKILTDCPRASVLLPSLCRLTSSFNFCSPSPSNDLATVLNHLKITLKARTPTSPSTQPIV